MDPRVEKLKTPAECETFIANARARDRDDLALEARHRSIQLRAAGHETNSEVERQCLEAICAYEEALSVRKTRRVSATQTWQLVKRHGVLGAVDRVVSRPDDTTGYEALVEMGLKELSFEAVVVRYPDEFSFEAVERSRARISKGESHV
jgi:hypothetical protein